MFGLFNYDRPGKGVQRRDPNQSRISLYFELFFRKMWNLCKANLLYILLIVPAFAVTMYAVGIVTSPIVDAMAPILAKTLGLATVDVNNGELGVTLFMLDMVLRVFFSLNFVVFFGAGPATAGLTYVLRNYAREEHAWLGSDIWRNIKVNFKQSIGLWIMDLVVLFVISVAFKFYLQFGAVGTVARYILILVALLYLMMHIYVHQIMITFELSFKNVLKNSVIMAIATAPKTIILLLIQAVVHAGIPYLLYVSGGIGLLLFYTLLEILFLPAATAFTTNFFIYPHIEGLIKQAQASKKADEDELKDDSAEK